MTAAEKRARGKARRATPAYRAYMKAYFKSYYASAAGHAIMRRAMAKYEATSVARAKKAARNKTYEKSDVKRAWVAKYVAAGGQLASTRRYLTKNPGLRRSWAVKRRAAEIKATPSWANSAAIESIYAEAARLTRETGIIHHVDHIYPLRGRTVSGLHVEHNLQILKATENLKKSNKHPDRLVA